MYKHAIVAALIKIGKTEVPTWLVEFEMRESVGTLDALTAAEFLKEVRLAVKFIEKLSPEDRADSEKSAGMYKMMHERAAAPRPAKPPR